MIKIKVASRSGFCLGVKRAVKLAETLLQAGKTVSTVGHLIHNPDFVQHLESRGLNTISRLDQCNEGVLLVRSHGMESSLIKEALQKGLEVVDGTCPFLLAVHKRVASLKDRYNMLLVGDARHAEVKCIKAIAPGKIKVIPPTLSPCDLPVSSRIAILSQSTQPPEILKRLNHLCLDKYFEILTINSICKETVKRQTEAVSLAQECDVILVVGGKISANTNHLKQLCQKVGNSKVFHIETEKEIQSEWFKAENTDLTVGILSGASTPGQQIVEIAERVKKRFDNF